MLPDRKCAADFLRRDRARRVIFNEELVKQGHQLTLFASGNSLTSAELVPCTKTALRLTPTVRDPIPYYMLMLDKVRERADEFDILHFHIDQFHFPIFRPMAQRTLTTLHGRQDLPDLQALYRGFTDMPLVSISNAQRRPCAAANFAATVIMGYQRSFMQPTSIGVEATSHFLGEFVRKSASITRFPSRELLEFLSRSRPRLTKSTRTIFERPSCRC